MSDAARGEPTEDGKPAASDLSASFVKCALVAVITIGVLARALTFQSPIFDLHAWRQADTAAIARNFVNERFNPLYPQVDYRGSRADGYVESGLELYAFVVASIARVVGFSTELGRLLNTCLFTFAALFLYRFIAARYGVTSGLVGACVYAFGLPLTLFIDRAFMNESLLTLLTIICLWSTQAYLRGGRWLHLFSLIVASTLIAMIKPTFLIVWAPIFGLFAERYGVRAVARPEMWIAGLLNLGAIVLWFSHAHSLFLMTGFTFGVNDKLFDSALLMSPDYVPKIATRMMRDILGPLGLVFASVGAVAALRRGYIAEAAGVLSFALYLVVVTVGNFHHNYYQLPIVPIATVLIALGITDGVARVGRNRHWSSLRMQVACAAIVWLLALTTFVRSASFHNWYEIDPAIVYLCTQVRAKLSPSDRVVIVGSKSPALLFCLDRKGWLLDPEEASAERLAGVAREGADMMVLEGAAGDAQRFLDDHTRLELTVNSFAVYRVDH